MEKIAIGNKHSFLKPRKNRSDLPTEGASSRTQQHVERIPPGDGGGHGTGTSAALGHKLVLGRCLLGDGDSHSPGTSPALGCKSDSRQNFFFTNCLLLVMCFQSHNEHVVFIVIEQIYGRPLGFVIIAVFRSHYIQYFFSFYWILLGWH